MNEELESKLKKLVNLLDKNSDFYKLENLKYQIESEYIISELAESNLVDKDKYRIASDSIRAHIKIIINKIKNSNELYDDFMNEINEFKKRIGQEDFNRYTVVFPLNFCIEDSNIDGYDILGKKIINLDYDEWKNRYKSKLDKEDKLKMALNTIPNEFSKNFTYWKFVYEANDTKFVTDKLQKLLGILLGEINYSLNVHYITRYQSDTYKLNKSNSMIKLPFILLFYEEGEFNDFFLDKDPTKRNLYEIKGQDRDRYKEIFPDLPNFSGKENEIDRKLARSFRLYQEAMENSSFEDSFLSFWRGFELLTLTTKEETHEEICKKIMSVVSHEDRELFEKILEGLRKKRNSLVHEGYDCEINLQDLNLSKLTFEHIIIFYLYNKDDYDKEDFEYILNNYHKGNDCLKYFKDKKIRHIKLIDDMLAWE